MELSKQTKLNQISKVCFWWMESRGWECFDIGGNYFGFWASKAGVRHWVACHLNWHTSKILGDLTDDKGVYRIRSSSKINSFPAIIIDVNLSLEWGIIAIVQPPGTGVTKGDDFNGSLIQIKLVEKNIVILPKTEILSAFDIVSIFDVK